MVIKLYISGISGNKEVKKKQQRVQMILDSKQISYEAIDITEPGKEKDKEFMQQNGKVRESLGKHPLPPQIFNDDDFCGDYEDFDMANEVDELEKFLHIETKDSANGLKEFLYKIISEMAAMDLKDSDIKLISELLENPVSQNEESQSIKSKQSNNSMYDPYHYHTVKIKWSNVNGMQEQIIINDELMEENKEIGEATKSEVNGESETAFSSQPLSETNLNTEASSESVPAPEKEEDFSADPKNAEEENLEENPERENNQQDIEAEEEENRKTEEEVDNPKEEEQEKEESPRAEEEEANNETSEKEETENEGDSESGRESPEMEKSQDD